MSKLNSQQRNYLKSIESKKTRKKMKKEFIKSNEEKTQNDSTIFLKKFFSKILPQTGYLLKNNPDFIEKKKDFHNAIDEHLEKEARVKALDIDGVTHFFISPFINRKDINNDEFFEQVTNMSKLYDSKLVKEFAEYSPPDSNKVKKYTVEDMEKCFNESRLTHAVIGFKHTNFAEYLKLLDNEKQ